MHLWTWCNPSLPRMRPILLPWHALGCLGFLKEASTCRIDAALDIGFYHVLGASELQLDRERADRIACTNMGTVPVAAS
jgi:hypothetical protein